MSIMESLTRRTGPAGLKCPGSASVAVNAKADDAACTSLHPSAPATRPPAESGQDDDPPSDAELIAAVRAGDVKAYGDLWRRHVAAAYNLARQLARSQDERDDLVSEAFAKVLDKLRAGRGPDSAFRAYLLTTLRHTAYDKTRRDRPLELADDVTEVSGVPTDAIAEFPTDTAVATLERWLAAKAFCRLPERWQAVLWHTVIEQLTPAQAAPVLGMPTANSVSALAYRARAGLCTAYMQAQVPEPNRATRCRATLDRLGAWTCADLGKREAQVVEEHLVECDDCLARVRELADNNPRLFRQWDHAKFHLALQCA